VSVVGALAAGCLAAVQPALVALPAALILAVLLFLSPRSRIPFLVFGGLLVFQSSDQLTAQKMAFFMGAGIAVAGAFIRARDLSSRPAYYDVAPLFRASVAFVLLVCLSLPVALAHGTPPTAWLRDTAPYLLFAAAPLLAFDAHSAFSERALRGLLVAAGLAGCAAFAAHWLSRRGIVGIPSAFGLPTFLLGAALFSYAMAVVLEGERRRLRWLLLAAAVAAGFLTTGTRSSAVLLAAPIAIVLGSRRHFARRSIRLAVVLPAVALLVLVGVRSLVQATDANRNALEGRISLVFQTGGARDRSYFDRRAQASAAWGVFEDAPVLGKGPGHEITWADSFGKVTTSANVDSPASYFAKFGLLGLIPAVVLVLSFVEVLRRLRSRTGERTIAQFGLIGFAGVFAAWSFLGVPIEDKGLSSGLALLLALALAETSPQPERAELARAS
jgi:hypothetical protein